MAIIVKNFSWEVDTGEKGYRKEKKTQLSNNNCQKLSLGGGPGRKGEQGGNSHTMCSSMGIVYWPQSLKTTPADLKAGAKHTKGWELSKGRGGKQGGRGGKQGGRGGKQGGSGGKQGERRETGAGEEGNRAGEEGNGAGEEGNRAGE